MNELIEQMAAKAPAGAACPTCGGDTRLVVFGEQWCSRCKVLRPCAGDPRAAAGAAPAVPSADDRPEQSHRGAGTREAAA